MVELGYKTTELDFHSVGMAIVGDKHWTFFSRGVKLSNLILDRWGEYYKGHHKLDSMGS